jgi:hypothetical protein
MMTSIFLVLALLPEPARLELGWPGPPADQPALAAPASMNRDQRDVIRAEAADDESEEEELEGPGPAADFVLAGNEAGLNITTQRSIGSAHQRHPRDRRRSARSPPRPVPLMPD